MIRGSLILLAGLLLGAALWQRYLAGLEDAEDLAVALERLHQPTYTFSGPGWVRVSAS
jgi:hypothetical protein